jgi:pimeloyl-ACP methyl ester carboxylesterase
MKKIIRYRNENTVSYAEYGDKNGYPILINHGLIASIDDCGLFERLIDLGAYLISIARPGYGESSPYVMENIGEWGDLAAVVIDELGLSQFDVLGLSSGAPYSYAIGQRFPAHVRNIYILSGIPALYDEEVIAHWPFPVTKHASLAEMQKLARELFFSNLSREDLERNDIKDSMQNDCFGIAQDLKLRCLDWGFRLSEVQANVYMRHSQPDSAVPFVTALHTAKLLPHCRLEARENDEHFSQEVLDDYIRTTIAANYESKGNF